MTRRVWVTVRRTVQIQAKRSAASVTGTYLLMNQTGSRFILPANEVLTHDADGNLTSDGHWTYTWDAENRLIAMEEKTSTRQPPGLMVRQRLEFRYDAGGRRIAKKVLHAEGNGTFVLKSSQVFLYDGWNMIGEFILQNSSFILQRSYEWGPDVSGSFTGAGGVGGLILIRQPASVASNGMTPPTSFAPLYDGNGNITELCALSTSTITARYEYSAFGETITTDGSAIADSNPFRFSTKYEDRETGFYYYGYRYYAPETGRWLSRDPMGEKGGLNLYGMVSNDALNQWDYLGLACSCDEVRKQLDQLIAAAESWNSTSPAWDWNVGGYCSGNECGEQAQALINAVQINAPCILLELAGGTTAGGGFGRMGTSNHHVVLATPRFHKDEHPECNCPDIQPVVLDPYKNCPLWGDPNPSGKVPVTRPGEFSEKHPHRCPCGHHKHPNGSTSDPYAIEFAESPGGGL